MNEFDNAPYTAWLEESVKSILDFKPDHMALVAMRDSDGMALTGYYEAMPQDMSMFIHHIQSDLVMEIIEANIPNIRQMLEEDDDPEEPSDDDLESGFDPYLGSYTGDC